MLLAVFLFNLVFGVLGLSSLSMLSVKNKHYKK